MTDSCKYQLISPGSAGETEDLLRGKDSAEGLRRVQALLSDWLRMENVVVLTAAGCSVGAGGRLMSGPAENNLECLVIDAVEKCTLGNEAKAVIQWKKDNYFGQGNFESWLSYLFNASTMTDDCKSPIKSIKWKNDVELDDNDGKDLCNWVQKAIFVECALQIDRAELSKHDSSETSGHIPFLAKLIARDATLGRTHLFTLNYDTLFEQAMEELGIHYSDGFTGKAYARFDPSVYGLDLYYPGDIAEGRVRRFDKFLQFYKLHGSVHWRQDEDGSFHAQHQDLSKFSEYRDKNVEEKAILLQSEEFKSIPRFGILPTSQKFSQTLEMPYAHLFRLFHGRLNQPQTFLMVLGYGFSDDHVTRIVETALMNPSLVMLVVEPNPESIIVKKIRNYQSLGQRAFVLTERVANGSECSYKIATFADFAQNVMPDVKWLEDYKRLRIFEDQIKKTQDINSGS